MHMPIHTLFLGHQLIPIPTPIYFPLTQHKKGIDSERTGEHSLKKALGDRTTIVSLTAKTCRNPVSQIDHLASKAKRNLITKIPKASRNPLIFGFWFQKIEKQYKNTSSSSFLIRFLVSETWSLIEVWSCIWVWVVWSLPLEV